MSLNLGLSLFVVSPNLVFAQSVISGNTSGNYHDHLQSGEGVLETNCW